MGWYFVWFCATELHGECEERDGREAEQCCACGLGEDALFRWHKTGPCVSACTKWPYMQKDACSYIHIHNCGLRFKRTGENI